MKTFLKVLHGLMKTMKVLFIVFLICLASLFFREQELPGCVVDWLAVRFVPPELFVHGESVTFGFRSGVTLRGVRVFNRSCRNPTQPLMSAELVSVDILGRRVRLVEPKYLRLPDSYYAPGNLEKNAPVKVTFPEIPAFTLVAERGDILGVRPARVEATVKVAPDRLTFEHITLNWPERAPMTLDGFCVIDIARQELYGEVDGLATQAYIRPLIVALDVPVALPYMDAFTEVPSPVKAWCGWKVALVNNDFDLSLQLHPDLGRYAGVPFKHADGTIGLHAYTRGTNLNYRTTVGPIFAHDVFGRTLSGTVVIDGTNGYNTVDVEAQSTMRALDILKVGGFTGEYVSPEVIGDTSCRLQFRFPRAMTNNYEALDGFGHVTVRNGQLMKMRGMLGLVELLTEKVPLIDYLTERTQATCDYTIEKGVIRVSRAYIEGGAFSIKLTGTFDAMTQALDFRALVQFGSSDSFVGKVLHPTTWLMTKLMLEFKLTGTATEPKWGYVSVYDRVADAFGAESPEEDAAKGEKP